MSGFTRTLWLASLALVVIGCGESASPTARPVPQVSPLSDLELTPAKNPQRARTAQPADRKVIYHSEISIVVEDLDKAQQQLTVFIDAVKQAGGYLSSQDVSGASGGNRTGSWTVRVPLSEFDTFVADVEKLGELVRNSQTAQDVTEAYADIEARLKNKIKEEERLLSHLQKSDVLKDTLELERELSRVRGEIEQLQGQLNLLKNKTDLATVDVKLFQRSTYTPPQKPTFGVEFRRQFQDSCRGMLQFGKVLAYILAFLTPWLVVGVPLAYLARFAIRKCKSQGSH